MNGEIGTIVGQHEFDELSYFLDSMFNTGTLIPRQVFKPLFHEYLFEEFDRTMSDEFWDTLQRLAALSSDSHVVMAVLQPNPMDYFYREFGYYNWFKIPSSLTRDDYWSILQSEPEDSPADAIISNSEVIVWASPSKKWAIWGERSAEICIMANRLETNLAAISMFRRWRSVDTVIKQLRPSNFAENEVPLEFVETLKINYSTGFDGAR